MCRTIFFILAMVLMIAPSAAWGKTAIETYIDNQVFCGMDASENQCFTYEVATNIFSWENFFEEGTYGQSIVDIAELKDKRVVFTDSTCRYEISLIEDSDDVRFTFEWEDIEEEKITKHPARVFTRTPAYHIVTENFVVPPYETMAQNKTYMQQKQEQELKGRRSIEQVINQRTFCRGGNNSRAPCLTVDFNNKVAISRGGGVTLNFTFEVAQKSLFSDGFLFNGLSLNNRHRRKPLTKNDESLGLKIITTARQPASVTTPPVRYVSDWWFMVWDEKNPDEVWMSFGDTLNLDLYKAIQ